MDVAYISAFSGLLGAAVGGLTTTSTTWLSQRTQLREKHLEDEKAKREALFNDFIAEATRLYADALSHEKDDVTDLVRLYALVARMRLLVSRAVILAAENVMNSIIAAYLAPNLSLHELQALAQSGGMNFLPDFSETCRLELTRPPTRLAR